jgi:hypothetical protein
MCTWVCACAYVNIAPNIKRTFNYLDHMQPTATGDQPRTQFPRSRDRGRETVYELVGR